MQETLQQRAITVAHEMSFEPQIVLNVVNAETGGTWDCSKVGDAGERGCLQIIPKMHPDVDPMDFDASVRYFITEYNNGHDYWWTSCSCVQFAKAIGTKIPAGLSADDLVPNTTLASLKTGDLVLFRYRNGKRHVGVYKGLLNGKLTVSQSNYESCKIDTWHLDPAEPTIYGFWQPEATSTTNVVARRN